MKYGPVKHISQLQIGDVVRPLHGVVRVDEYKHPRITYTTSDGIEHTVSMSNGWRPLIGGTDDFRHGYDTMTVIVVSDQYVDFKRPYIHVYAGQTKHGVELVSYCSRTHGGLWYELLQAGQR